MSRKQQGTNSQTKRKRSRKQASAIEEITFNPDDRADYLTGFHKRKLQRIKHAQDEAAKKERLERIAARKRLREDRKSNLEKHVEAVNSATYGSVDEDHADSGSDDDERASWEGCEDGVEEKTTREDEYYSDDDKHTTVTVEPVDVSREGLKATSAGEGNGPNQHGHEPQSANEAPSQRVTTAKGMERDNHHHASRSRRKKFHYESKAERKAARFKQKLGNRIKAKARRG